MSKSKRAAKPKRLTKAEQAALSIAFIKEQGKSWKVYERTTPYECAQRRVAYDHDACLRAWNAHMAVYDKYEQPRPWFAPKHLDLHSSIG